MRPVDWVILFYSIIPYIPLSIGAIKDPYDKSLDATTWWLYFILDLITCLTTIEKDGSYVILLAFTIGSFVIASILTWQRRFVWDKINILTIGLVFGCIMIWYFCGPYLALILGVVSESIVGVHLVYRTYLEPKVKYNLFSYTMFLAVAILTLIFVPAWDFKHIGFAISEIILGIATISILLVQKKKESGSLFYK